MINPETFIAQGTACISVASVRILNDFSHFGDLRRRKR